MSTEQVSSSARSAAPPAAGRSLALLLVGAFMALLDTTIVNVALPSVQEASEPGRVPWSGWCPATCSRSAWR
jgi:hypothetical protein